MSEEVKFDLDKDIIMQIEMDSYMKYNGTIASMNDHLGEIYDYSDVRDTEEAQLKYEKELAYKAIAQLQQKLKENNNIINELEWKPIEEYFNNKENYDWVLIKYYDKYNFECIPTVAEYRIDKWYLRDTDEPLNKLNEYEVKYFFDMQQLDKLKELKEDNK